MNIALWVLQGLLALGFIGAGITKLTRTKEQLQPQMAYVEDFSQGQIRAIGAAEVLGALGVILPGLTGILPILTPIAASGLTILMLGAVYTHIRRKEQFIPPLALLIMAVLVAVGRFVVSPL